MNGTTTPNTFAFIFCLLDNIFMGDFIPEQHFVTTIRDHIQMRGQTFLDSDLVRKQISSEYILSTKRDGNER